MSPYDAALLSHLAARPGRKAVPATRAPGATLTERLRRGLVIAVRALEAARRAAPVRPGV